MSLRVQLYSSQAKLPKEQADGSYEIYSAETKRINPGGICPISTEIILSIPVGFYILITSCNLVSKYNIETSTYSSLLDKEYKLSNGESQPISLILFLRNYGKIDYMIKAGDPIGRMIIVRSRVLPVLEVSDINQADDKETNKIVIMRPKIKALSKTSMSWFKNLYKNDPVNVSDKYLTPEIILLIEEFKKTDLYLVAGKKNTVEANYVWKLLIDHKDIKQKIASDFALVKNVGNTEDSFETKSKKEKIKKPKAKPKTTVNIDDLDAVGLNIDGWDSE
jgi:dUTPase